MPIRINKEAQFSFSPVFILRAYAVLSYYEHSIPKALTTLFPNVEWDAFQFEKRSSMLKYLKQHSFCVGFTLIFFFFLKKKKAIRENWQALKNWLDKMYGLGHVQAREISKIHFLSPEN